jgi:hypothetical protein
MAMADGIRVPKTVMPELERAATAGQRSAEEIVTDALVRYLRLKRREKLYSFGEDQARRLCIRKRDVPELIKQTRGERGR